MKQRNKIIGPPYLSMAYCGTKTWFKDIYTDDLTLFPCKSFIIISFFLESLVLTVKYSDTCGKWIKYTISKYYSLSTVQPEYLLKYEKNMGHDSRVHVSSYTAYRLINIANKIIQSYFIC